MKKTILPFLFYATVLGAQTSVFKEFDVMIYPEYYFPGIMVEINGTADTNAVPITIKFTVPAGTDSVFYVAGKPDQQAEVIPLTVRQKGDRHFIVLKVKDEQFRAFVFYNMETDGQKRKGKFTFQVDHHLGDAHLVIQEPIMAQNFKYSEDGAEPFKDQHGLSFRRVHLHDKEAGSVKTVSFSYDNPTGETTIVQLQKMLSGSSEGTPGENPHTTESKPQRHTLPLWQPMAVLFAVALLVGGVFNAHKKREKVIPVEKGKFCTSCGKPVSKKHKFCANCGEKI